MSWSNLSTITRTCGKRTQLRRNWNSSWFEFSSKSRVWQSPSPHHDHHASWWIDGFWANGQRPELVVSQSFREEAPGRSRKTPRDSEKASQLYHDKTCILKIWDRGSGCTPQPSQEWRVAFLVGKIMVSYRNGGKLPGTSPNLQFQWRGYAKSFCRPRVVYRLPPVHVAYSK